MNEDVFNTSLRKFLKKVGITSQREIEKAVRDAVAAGRLKGHEKLPAKMVLTLGGVSLSHEITDEIELGYARNPSPGRVLINHQRPLLGEERNTSARCKYFRY
jgi:hypothetical protein